MNRFKAFLLNLHTVQPGVVCDMQLRHGIMDILANSTDMGFDQGCRCALLQNNHIAGCVGGGLFSRGHEQQFNRRVHAGPGLDPETGTVTHIGKIEGGNRIR